MRFSSDSWTGKDLLGREAFANHLAQQIQAWRKKESLVIGLFGEWGNGKTVTKEMVLQKLRANQDTFELSVESDYKHYNPQNLPNPKPGNYFVCI